MATIQTALTNANTRSAAHLNALANAWKGLGHADDNAGRAVLLPALGPFPVRLGGVNEEAKAIGASTTYTVPAATWFVVSLLSVSAGGDITVTPSGGAAFIVLDYRDVGTIEAFAPHLILGPGDALTTPTGAAVVGTLLDAPSGMTRLLQLVDNAAPYTVPAGRRALLTAAVAGGVDTAILTVDGTYAARADSWGAYVSQATASNAANLLEPCVRTLRLAAGQRVGGSDSNDILISGIEETL